MVEVGDSFYTEVAVGNQFTQQWGYAAVDLGVAVPSVTIEAVRNRARSALPATRPGLRWTTVVRACGWKPHPVRNRPSMRCSRRRSRRPR